MEMLQEKRSAPRSRRGIAGTPKKRQRVTAVLTTVLSALLAWMLIEAALGIDLRAPTFEGSPRGFDIGPLEVILTSALASLAAWALLGLLERWSRRPGRLWKWIAGGAFVMSLSGPMSGGGIPAGHRWLLALLHAVVAVVLIPLLSRTAEAGPATRRGGTR